MFFMDMGSPAPKNAMQPSRRTAVYMCPEDGRPDNHKYPTVVETPDGATHVSPPVLSGGNVASMPFYQEFTDSLDALLAFKPDTKTDGAPAKYDLRAWEERGRRAWMAEWHAIHGVKGRTTDGSPEEPR